MTFIKIYCNYLAAFNRCIFLCAVIGSYPQVIPNQNSCAHTPSTFNSTTGINSLAVQPESQTLMFFGLSELLIINYSHTL